MAENTSLYPRYKSFLRVLPLVFLLMAGQLHAKPIYSCVMMDMGKHDATMDMDMDMQEEMECCRDRMACMSLDCEEPGAASQDSCYEQVIVVTVNHDHQENSPVLTTVIESDVDPPQVLVTTLDLALPSQITSALRVLPRYTEHIQSSSNIYLITLRLRT